MNKREEDLRAKLAEAEGQKMRSKEVYDQRLTILTMQLAQQKVVTLFICYRLCILKIGFIRSKLCIKISPLSS